MSCSICSTTSAFADTWTCRRAVTVATGARGSMLRSVAEKRAQNLAHKETAAVYTHYGTNSFTLEVLTFIAACCLLICAQGMVWDLWASTARFTQCGARPEAGSHVSEIVLQCAMLIYTVS